MTQQRRRKPLCGFKVVVRGALDEERFVQRMTDLLTGYIIRPEMERLEAEREAAFPLSDPDPLETLEAMP